MDEGAGTLKFIKIKNFIRSNSGWRVHRAVLAWRFLSSSRRSDGTCSSSVGMGGGRAKPGRRRAEGHEARGLHVSLETPERYYNYFTRTGIIKMETDASPGEKQASRNVLPLTLKTLFHRADSFADFWRKFPFYLRCLDFSRLFVAQGATRNSNRNWENEKRPWKLNIAYFMSILALEIYVTFDCLICGLIRV